MKKLNKKLQLNKETIATLSVDQQRSAYGGQAPTIPLVCGIPIGGGTTTCPVAPDPSGGCWEWTRIAGGCETIKTVECAIDDSLIICWDPC